MNEQNNDNLEPAEQPTAKEESADQSQSVDDVSVNEPVKTDAEEQTNYKAELETANQKIADLEKKYIMRVFHMNDEDYDSLIPKAKKLVDDETSLEDAFDLLEMKYPDKIQRVPYIDMGGDTK